MTTYIPALSNDSISAYIHNVLAVPDLERDEEERLFTTYRRTGDIDAARRIILANLKLVVNAAYRFRKFRDVVDLIQEGNVGLLTALKKFDLAKGVRFATYAIWWIKAKIQEFILSHMSIVRYGKGRDERKLFFNLVSTVREIESHDQGRDLSREELIGEVARRLNIDPIRVADNMRVLTSSSDVSLDEQYEDGTDRWQIADEKADFSEALVADERKQLLYRAVETLDERERYIIDNRYLTDDPQTLEDIGHRFNVSKERVRQIEERALEKIRKQATAHS